MQRICSEVESFLVCLLFPVSCFRTQDGVPRTWLIGGIVDAWECLERGFEIRDCGSGGVGCLFICCEGGLVRDAYFSGQQTRPAHVLLSKGARLEIRQGTGKEELLLCVKHIIHAIQNSVIHTGERHHRPALISNKPKILMILCKIMSYRITPSINPKAPKSPRKIPCPSCRPCRRPQS
jgi:hypothetical protein